MNTDQFKKGLVIRREVLGAAYVDKPANSSPNFMKPMQKLTTDWWWGEIGFRSGLKRKTSPYSTFADGATARHKTEQ